MRRTVNYLSNKKNPENLGKSYEKLKKNLGNIYDNRRKKSGKS